MDTTTKQDFIAYKSAGKYIVKLQVPVGSHTNRGRRGVADPNRAKFRTDKAHVLKIRHKRTGRCVRSVRSDHDPMVRYIVGEDVVPRRGYNLDPDEVCASGIHFFLTREPAYDYDFEIRNGIFQVWHDNGQLAATGMKKNNQMNGERKMYHENGALFRSDNWINGKESGLCKIWTDDGFLKGMNICDEGMLIKSIDYGACGHRMRFDIYDNYKLAMSMEYWHDTEISIEDKMNHEYQLLNNDILVLSPDYTSR